MNGIFIQGELAITSKFIWNKPRAESITQRIYPKTIPIRIGTSLKKPFAKIEQSITINNVKDAMARLIATKGVNPFARPRPHVASVIAVPAKFIPITTITGPVTTGGNTFLIFSAPIKYAIAENIK